MIREHVVEVREPVDGAEAMQAHLRVLLNAVKNFRAGRCNEDDIYVWWGHPQGSTDQAGLAALGQLLQLPLESSRNDPGPETHLYLTDFSSLYVAHLGGITKGDIPSKGRTHPAHV